MGTLATVKHWQKITASNTLGNFSCCFTLILNFTFPHFITWIVVQHFAKGPKPVQENLDDQKVGAKKEPNAQKKK
jgi:hypothetical protein